MGGAPDHAHYNQPEEDIAGRRMNHQMWRAICADRKALHPPAVDQQIQHETCAQPVQELRYQSPVVRRVPQHGFLLLRHQCPRRGHR